MNWLEKQDDWGVRAVAHARSIVSILAPRDPKPGTFGHEYLTEACRTISKAEEDPNYETLFGSTQRAPWGRETDQRAPVDVPEEGRPESGVSHVEPGLAQFEVQERRPIRPITLLRGVIVDQNALTEIVFKAMRKEHPNVIEHVVRKDAERVADAVMGALR